MRGLLSWRGKRNTLPDQLELPTSDSDSKESPIVLLPDGIKVLYDGPDAAVDVCFVHGLNGDRESTRTADRQSAPWPKTLIPDLISDRARCGASSRPPVFVAHSLGGLVYKKAILLSRNNPEPHLHSISDYTNGLAYWANLSASALSLVKSTNRSLLATVREQRKAGRPLEVTCFFEGLPSSVLGRAVTAVSKDSATLDGYSSFSIRANHCDMVKYGSAEDNGFKRLLSELIRWRDQARDSAAGQAPSTEAQIQEPVGSSFYNYGGDQVNAPGGNVNISRGSGNQLSGAGFLGPVHFG
ncbi:hypothetical protein C8A00DRAFT_46189 [Chaetomidium leptoderma]|uniref:NACHT-NTPase sigma domain-containing protein n=1 Tax=Chaetomidium leptoderma TaxID=669021 RepID=A0AAN6VFD9_9PEZI|nr:hypothetical protein C8A00DRAFT_46189 [Chaetomidium leptoderma]